MLEFLKPSQRKLTILASLYAALFVIAPVISNRIVDIFGAKVLLGSLLLIVALGLLDVINNDFGLQKARDVIVAGLVTRLVVWALVSALFLLPVLSEPVGFRAMVASSLTLLLAGEVSIFVSQYFVDVRVFDYLKTRYRSFIVRYNVSNLISYTLGLLVFLLLAFWDKDVDIVGLFFGQLGLRLVLQFALAPVFWILSPLSSSAEPIDPK